MPDDRPRNEKGHYLNKDGSVSLKQPSPYFLRQHIYRDEIDRAAVRARVMETVREREMIADGQLTVRKSPGQFTCPTCWVFDACEMHETGAEWEMVLKAISRPWDPYSEHEIRAGEQK